MGQSMIMNSPHTVRADKQAEHNRNKALRTELPAQRIQKVYPKHQKDTQMAFKFMPGEHLRAQKQAMVAWNKKKSNFGVWVHPRTHQKRSKLNLLETPRRLKMKLLNQPPKNMEMGYQLEAQGHALEAQNGRSWDACRRT